MPRPWPKTSSRRWSKRLDIQSLLTPPDDWQWGEFHNHNNNLLRYGWNCPDHAKGLIIFAEGHTESAEEYFENIRYFNAQGFACAIMDWQGQGLSYRYNDDTSRHHSKGFEVDIADFQHLMDMIALNPALSPLPKIIFAHSMGGNITLRYLVDHCADFTCAIIISPMLGLHPKRTIKYLARPLFAMARRFGWLERHALGQMKWSKHYANIAKHKISSDPVRREVQPYLFKTYPAMQCGGVTWGWLIEAMKSIHILHDPDTCAQICTPVFMALGAKDIVVDNDGLKKTASLLPDCETHIYQKAEHQIHREKDMIRDQLLADILAFIAKHQ